MEEMKKHAKPKVFTDQEKQYIDENWGKISIYKMKMHLNCTWEAIANYGRSKGYPMPVSKSTPWTDEETLRLIELAPRKHYKKIAKELNRTPEAIKFKAKKLGIILIQDARKWTLEEIFYLRENWGQERIEIIAKNLHRKKSAIKQKAQELELGPSIKADYDLILVSDICKMLDIPRDRVLKTFVNRGLFLRKKWISKNKFYYYVTYDDLLDYLKNNQDTWDSRNLELHALGLEEDWLKEKRKLDIREKPVLFRTWTSNEIQKAIDIFNNKKSYQAVAQELNRPLGSVKTVLREAGFSYRLPKFWQSSDILFLKNNYQSMTYQEIANHLNRSEKSVSKMAATLNYKKNNQAENFEYRKWTNEELSNLRDLVKTYSSSEIAKKLNRTKGAVERQIKIMNISVKSCDRLWTEEQEEELKSLWQTEKIAKIAKILERPITAVRKKAESMKLGLNKGDEILLSDICSLLNISREIVTNTYIKLGLPIKQNVTPGGRTYYTTEVSSLITFLQENQNVWDASNLEIGSLGEEWPWLQTKREKDLANRMSWQRIMSEKEHNLINFMYQNNFSIIDIANILSRPLELITCILGINKKFNSWCLSEIVFLMENYASMSFSEIGHIIGRTEEAVNTKAHALGLIKNERKRSKK